MGAQLRDRVQLQPLGDGTRYSERIAIFEAERCAHRQATPLQCLCQLGVSHWLRQSLQQLLGEGTDVFGIHVDAALEERLPENGAATECTLVLERETVALRLEPQNLRQNHRLGEILRAGAR